MSIFDNIRKSKVIVLSLVAAFIFTTSVPAVFGADEETAQATETEEAALDESAAPASETSQMLAQAESDTSVYSAGAEAATAGTGASAGLSTAAVVGLGVVAAGAVALGISALDDDDKSSAPAHGSN